MAILTDANAVNNISLAEASLLSLTSAEGVKQKIVEPSDFTLNSCEVVDRNFVLPSKYLNAVESKVNQSYETQQRWIIGA